jgi:AraC family transcriptional regulator
MNARHEPTRFESAPAFLLAGLRRIHSFGAAPRDIPAQWQEFAPLLPLPGQRGTRTFGATCAAWEAEQRFEYMCGAEVESLDNVPEGMGRVRVPPAHYAVFTHDGPISTIRQTWDAIFAWLAVSGRAPSQTPDFELYGELYDRHICAGIVEIWFPIPETA